MPGSTTTPDRLRTCDGVREHVAFRRGDDVSIRDQFPIAAQLLAYAYPCQRFAPHLTMRHA